MIVGLFVYFLFFSSILHFCCLLLTFKCVFEKTSLLGEG